MAVPISAAVASRYLQCVRRDRPEIEPKTLRADGDVNFPPLLFKVLKMSLGLQSMVFLVKVYRSRIKFLGQLQFHRQLQVGSTTKIFGSLN